MSFSKVLILGAGGAMGQYLVPLLVESGYEIDAVSLEEVTEKLPGVNYITANAKDKTFLKSLLSNNYHGIVDFLIHPSVDLPYYLPFFLDSCEHYMYVSTGRVYADEEHPIKESSPRLIDCTTDPLLKNSDDYCIYKARGENILQASMRKNWSIVRPATTYSFMRYQLVTLEAADNVGRAFANKLVVLPEQARNVQATLSWGGDVAKMLAGLLFNEKALGETYNVCSAEHRSWQEIADYYKDICNLQALWVDKEDYLKLLCPDPYNIARRWQLEYARLFTRITDNSKVLDHCNMKQSELMSLREGLEYEISRCPKDYPWPVNEAMDEYVKNYKK